MLIFYFLSYTGAPMRSFLETTQSAPRSLKNKKLTPCPPTTQVKIEGGEVLIFYFFKYTVAPMRSFFRNYTIGAPLDFPTHPSRRLARVPLGLGTLSRGDRD